MRGVVESVSRKPYGSVLASDLTAGDDILEVESAADFPDPDEGGTLDVTVGGQTVAYTGVLEADEYGSGVTVDTLTLDSAVLFGAPLGTNVELPGKTRYVAQVRLGDSALTEPAGIRHGLRKARQLRRAASGVNLTVDVERDESGDLWVTGLIDEDPDDDGAVIATGTLALSDAVDTTDATDEAVGPMLARMASWYGVTLDNPVITFEDSDGNGGRLDGPAATLSFRQGNNVVSSFSALVTRLAGLLDADQFTAAVARIFDELRIAPGGAIMLESQLQPPSAPAVEVGWPFVVLDFPHFADIVTSMTENGGRLYLIGTRGGRHGGTPSLRMYSYDLDGTDKQLEWEQPIAAGGLRRGLARIGSSWFIGVSASGIGAASHIQERDLTGALVNQWALTGIPGETEVCVGRDAAGHVLVLYDVFGSFDLQTYNTTGGAPLSTLSLSPGGTDAAFIGSDTFDYSGTRIVAIPGGINGGPFVYNSSGVEQVGDEWNAAPYNSGLKTSAGTCWDDTNGVWLELATDGTLYRYTTIEQSAGWDVLVDLSFLVTLRDASGHETAYDASKVTVASVRGRQGITVTAGAIPTGADRFALHVSENASPTRTQFHLVGTPAAGDRSWTLDVLTFAGANPPSSNTMPAGVAEIQDANGVKILASDNTGSLWDAIAAGGVGTDDDWLMDEETGDWTIYSGGMG